MKQMLRLIRSDLFVKDSFLPISKYDNKKLLWWIYGLINFGLISFIVLFLYIHIYWLYLLPFIAVFAAILLFGFYCYKAYGERLRKKVDYQVKISLLSVIMMAMPLLFFVDHYHIVIAFYWKYSFNFHLRFLYFFWLDHGYHFWNDF